MIEQLDAEKISPHRREALGMFFRLLSERKSEHILETGTLRKENNWHNDGGFTWLLARWASLQNGRNINFHTVDHDPIAIETSKRILRPLMRHVQHDCADSVQFLRHWAQPIDALILDSLDYLAGQEGQAQAQNLDEALAALPNLHAQSIVAIDDCKLAGGGKGALTIPYLQARGWRVICDDYVTVLTKL